MRKKIRHWRAFPLPGLSHETALKLFFVSGGAGEIHQVCEQPRPDPDGGGPGVATCPALSHEDCAFRQERKIRKVPLMNLTYSDPHWYILIFYCPRSKKTSIGRMLPSPPEREKKD
jgi:hypothetical protein